MGIRESINRKPGIAIAAVLLLLVGMGAFIVHKFRAEDNAPAATGDGPKAWYTVDDGKSWFPDRLGRVVPFDHQGKKAYRCYVWTCDDGKTTFVSHLERIKDSVRANLKKETFEPWELIPGSMEAKAPLTGDSGWIDSMSASYDNLRTPRCPGGRGIPQALPIP
jgi:hypothetical protein